MEEWKVIPGFPDYEASSFGKIRRIGKRMGAQIGHILKPWVDKRGYECVHLRQNGGKRNLRVHNLIGELYT
jgi:hypothetical protein